MTAKLTVADIADVRAYERERAEFRARIIELKRRRRVHIGPIVTLLFENRDTIQFQVQEMARAEQLHSDEQIQTELDIYNPLIPSEGELSATLFIELTDESEMRHWLPRLVGIERSVELQLLGPEGGPEVVRSTAEEQHEAQLTREDTTASVHYVRFELTPAQIDALAGAPATIAVNHRYYQHATPLSDETKAELLADLRGPSEPQR
jgi:hypothetical protein